MNYQPFLFILSVIGSFSLLVLLSNAITYITTRRKVKRLQEIAHLSNNKKEIPDGLPQPVLRYFQTVLPKGTDTSSTVYLNYEGTFRSRPGQPLSPISGEQWFSMSVPGFIWHGLITSRWYWWRRARLVFLEGRGSGLVKLFGAMTLFDPEGDEVDVSLLVRWLTEAVWFPPALIPTYCADYELRWEAINASSARAVLSMDGNTVSAVFHFDENGYIDRVITSDKFRDANTNFVKETFTMNCSEYRLCGAYMIPMNVRLIWNLREGDFEYGFFTVEDAQFS